MTKAGKLSKRDRDALLRAADILNQWCDAHGDLADSTGEPMQGAYDSAADAAGAIHNFLYETRGE